MLIFPRDWSILRKKTYLWLKEQLRHTIMEGTLVDLGAGDGGGYSELYGGYKTISIDDTRHSNINVIADLSIFPWPIPANSADVVIAANFFEHTKDPKRTLDECWNILKPSGTLYIIVPFMMGVHQAPRDYERITYYGWRYLLREEFWKDTVIDPIGTPYDVLMLTRGKAFGYMYDKDRPLSTLMLKLYHRLTKMVERVVMAGMERRPSNPHFCLGYCIRVRKI